MLKENETWAEKTARETSETFRKVESNMASGMPVTEAINRSAHTAETYSAALKKYNLKPVIPD